MEYAVVHRVAKMNPYRKAVILLVSGILLCCSSPLSAQEKIKWQDKISINYDGPAELTTLPGIGNKKAKKIIDYRKLYGRFKSTADIVKVHGIGKKTYQALKPYITVRKVKRPPGYRPGGAKARGRKSRDIAVVNINTAGISILRNLPSIGPARADRIIRHREENGPFKCKSELMDVPGIGKGIFSSLEPHIKVRNLDRPTHENVEEAGQEKVIVID